jgi:hypothetical protein
MQHNGECMRGKKKLRKKKRQIVQINFKNIYYNRVEFVINNEKVNVDVIIKNFIPLI